MALDGLDWWVIGCYLVGMVVLSAWLGRSQGSSRDYYLAGNRVRPLPVALSTVATQCSTNSLLGAPAFVAFAGGLVWLQYELAVPFAMAALILFVYPVFRRLKITSVYSYLEMRFGVETRVTLAGAFMLLRAFATGVTVYGVSLVIEAVTGLPFWGAVLLLGGVTVVYDVLGGMRAVIWSDVIQLIILSSAILGASAMALYLVGGFGGLLVHVDAERLQPLDFTGTGFGDGQLYTFLPMLLGGFFLYLSYYGCDQTQAQRELSTASPAETNRALFLDGLLRFPLVLAYCFLGVCLAAYAHRRPEFLASLPLRGSEPTYELAVPFFAIEHFPAGLTGLVLAGLFAAAMSSLDSTINSLSAVSMEDGVKRFWKPVLKDREALLISRSLTVFWGGLCLFFSFHVGDIAPTILEAVNIIGSVVNGPILGVFLLGLLTRRGEQWGALVGFAVGLLLNLALGQWAPSISWLWWNPIGFFTTFGIGWAIGTWRRGRLPELPVPEESLRIATTRRADNAKPLAAWLMVYGGIIFAVLGLITLAARGLS